MGIGQTIKNMLGEENPVTTSNNTTQATVNKPHVDGQIGNQNATLGSPNAKNDNTPSAFGSNADRGTTSGSKKLNEGTGVGTTGRGNAVSGEKAQNSHGVNGKEYEATKGGTTQRSIDEPNVSHRGTHDTGTNKGGHDGNHHHLSNATGVGLGGGLHPDHKHGHRTAETVIPTQDVTNESHQIHPVTQETRHNREIEEVTRDREHDIHVHHVQHHAQPVLDKDVRDETHHNKVHPVTNVREQHTNRSDATDSLHGQVHHHQDTTEQGQMERVVIDKGENLNEREHHHVHHIVQPVINKETIEQHRIHTTIPIHHVTHEAPIVHKTQTHAPVTLEHFAQKGGQLSGGLSHDQVGGKVLRKGECTREVDGVGEKLLHDLVGDGQERTGGYSVSGNKAGYGSTGSHVTGGKDVDDRKLDGDGFGKHSNISCPGTGNKSTSNYNQRQANSFNKGGHSITTDIQRKGEGIFTEGLTDPQHHGAQTYGSGGRSKGFDGIYTDTRDAHAGSAGLNDRGGRGVGDEGVAEPEASGVAHRQSNGLRANAKQANRY